MTSLIKKVFNLSDWVKPAWGGTMLLTTLLITQPSAANHLHTGNPQLHISSQHFASGTNFQYGYDDEDVCFESKNLSYISHSQLQTILYDALYWRTPRWDGLYNGSYTQPKIDPWVTSSNCSSYSDQSWVEIRTYVTKNNSDFSSKWCDENFSCVSHLGPVYSPNAGHTHHTSAWVMFDYDNLGGTAPSDQTAKLVNHEYGHVWGLLDGPGGFSCSPTSIMHNNWYGCSYSGWQPTSADFNSVNSATNP